jgi:hypothetical protein
MLKPMLDAELEAATVALNACLYADDVGLPLPADAYAEPMAALEHLYAHILAEGESTYRPFAIDAQAEARRLAQDRAVAAAMDEHLALPGQTVDGQPLTWRNWKAFERAVAGQPGGADLQAAFAGLVAQSAALVPALEARAAQLRADYAPHGLTPVHLFAAREGVSVAQLRALLERVGRQGRPAFAAVLDRLAQRVFGRAAGPAELRALYLNLMYAPAAGLFDAATAVRDTLAAFSVLDFDLGGVSVDVEDRPRKYPGAFCFPVQIPGDVRVSVRTATAHHLVDMLYHEFGHAVHFSGIAPERSFLERYWILAGTHEVFSTLFESLLGEPRYLAQQFGLDGAGLRQLLDFAEFKRLLTGAWLGAAALTVLDAWLEGLAWPKVEERYGAHMRAFTGVAMPAGFARLEPFTATLSIYPAGYVLAEVRVAHWLRRLRALGGEAWWQSAAARADIRAHVVQGGAVRWPAAWNEPIEAAASNRATGST